ncbi:MAG: hypothetical protein AB7K09_15360 [Planctomycetota bacterium]
MKILPSRPADTLQAIHTRLRTPRPCALPPINNLHDGWYAGPDDADDWSPPATHPQLEQRLDRLPRRQAVICAIVAAEMVLPVWRDAAVRHGWRASWRLAPEVALRNTRRWFAGEFRMTDLGDTVDNLMMVFEARRSGPLPALAVDPTFPTWRESDPGRYEPDEWALVAAWMATMAGAMCGDGNEVDRRNREWRRNQPPAQIAITAVTAASHVNAVIDPLRSGIGRFSAWYARFMTRWWSRCTARLAIRDVTTATLS